MTYTIMPHNKDFPNGFPQAKIENYYKESACQPVAFACLAYDEGGIYVYQKAFEAEIKAVMTEQNGDIYKDSCLEFFINFSPEQTDDYLNYEINPLGVMHLGLGPDRYCRTLLFDSDKNYFNIKCLDSIDEFNKEYWEISYYIPFDYIRKHFPGFSLENTFKGNFFKIGDQCKLPHYGTYAKVDTPTPDFHRREFFSDFVIGK